MSKKKKICVKVYFNEASFAAVAEQAEKSGKRRRGLQLYTQKKNGMANELISNTDGIGRHLKFTARYWIEHEAEILRKAADLKAKEDQIAKERAALGIS